MKKIRIAIIFLVITISLNISLKSEEYVQSHFKFVKQGFCLETKDRKEKDFPYLIKCKSDGVWGLRKESVKIGENNYLVLKNFVTDKYKYIGAVSSIDKIRGFDFNSNYLFITFGNKHYQFFYSDFDKTDTIAIVNHNVIRSKSYYENKDINIRENLIFLHKSYPGEIFNGKASTTYIQTIDTTGKISNYHNFPVPKGEYFGINEPSNNFALNNNFLALSDRTRYKIYFYDYNYNKVDSIYKKWNIPNRVSDEDMNRYEDTMNLKTTQMANIISHFNTDCWDNKSNHIRIINFLNDSTLLICYKVPVPDSIVSLYSIANAVFDIWKFSNNKWSIYKENLQDCNSFKNGRINTMCQGYFTHFEAGEEYLFIKSTVPFMLETEMNYEDYKKKENEYYLENSDPYGYFIYRFDK